MNRPSGGSLSERPTGLVSERRTQRTRLHRLVQSVEIVDEPQGRTLPAGVRLPAKDVPILLAAIESRANYLLTGDKDHFGAYFDRRIRGVLILRPSAFLDFRRTL